jgi:transcriptional regulator with GAF, ATPase, and Fis domain
MDEMIADGRFRKGLLWRLNAMPIHMPPLRERRGDIIAVVPCCITSRKRRPCRKYG